MYELGNIESTLEQIAHLLERIVEKMETPATVKVPPFKFQVGDLCRVAKDGQESEFHGFHVNDIVKIVVIDADVLVDDAPYWCEMGDEAWWCEESDLELVSRPVAL